MHRVQFIIQTNRPAYRKHQHRDYTYKTVRFVYATTKLTTSTFYNCKRFTDCILSFNNDHVNILIYVLILLSCSLIIL